LYFTIIREIKQGRMRWARRVASKKETINTYRILVGKRKRRGKRGRLRTEWEDIPVY
jgi:hypothetical protein